MVTAKKPAVKKAAPKKVLVQSKVVATAKKTEEFRMPMEVKEWIDQASSRMMSMRTEIDRLKEDNQKLRRANKIMEQRVMGMSVE
jgi:hypothetical protein